MVRSNILDGLEQEIWRKARSYKYTMKAGQHPSSGGVYPDFRWWEVQCSERGCVQNLITNMGLTANCDHIRLIRDLGLDAEYMMKSAKNNNQPYNAVLASLRLRSEYPNEDLGKRGYINFAISFPDLGTIWNDKEPRWGSLWMVHPEGGRKGYKFEMRLEDDVVLSRPEKMTTNGVRTLGLQYLVEQYFNGIQCDSPNHGLRGKTLLDQPRKVSNGHWRNIHVLDEVARIISDGVCLTCQNSPGSFGLADL